MRARPTRFRPRFLLLPCLLAAICVSTGCSFAFRYAYNHADWLVYRKLDPFLDLNDAQRAVFDARFAELWQWHRRSELPRYADTLHALADRIETLDAPVTPATLDAQAEPFTEFARRIKTRALPHALELLSTLTDAQVAGLVAQVEEKDEEFREEFLSGDADNRADHYADWTEDKLDDWLGHVTDPQQALVRQWAAGRRDHPDRVMQARAARRAALRSLLDDRRDADFARRLAAFIEDPSRYRSTARQADAAFNRQHFLQMLARVINLADAEQRAHAADRLRDYADDFAELARESEA